MNVHDFGSFAKSLGRVLALQKYQTNAQLTKITKNARKQWCVCECAICAHTKSVPTFRSASPFLLGVHTANKYLATKCGENSLQCVRQSTTRISALKFMRFFSLPFFRAKDFHFGFVFFRCIIRVFSFRCRWIIRSFVRLLIQYQRNSSCIQTSVGCEIGKSYAVRFLLHLFSTVLNKHFLSYDESGKIDVSPNGIGFCVRVPYVESFAGRRKMGIQLSKQR